MAQSNRMHGTENKKVAGAASARGKNEVSTDCPEQKGTESYVKKRHVSGVQQQTTRTARRLTKQQRQFAVEFSIDQDAHAAAVRAGYSPRTACAAAKRLLAREDIWQLVTSGSVVASDTASAPEQECDCSIRDGCACADVSCVAAASANSTVRQGTPLQETLKQHAAEQAMSDGKRFDQQALGGDAQGERTSGKGQQQKAAQPNVVTQESVVRELALLGFSNLKDVCQWDDGHLVLHDSGKLTKEQAASIAEITETVTSRGGTVRVKLHSKLKALEMLAKHVGLYELQEDGEGASIEELSPVVRKKLEAIYGVLPVATHEGE
ncbi:MAG: terminase small subunit [Desulfovibrionales bacterium]|nr:terminase small subunit [Desulfovibrionales bacterium]